MPIYYNYLTIYKASEWGLMSPRKLQEEIKSRTCREAPLRLK